VLAGLLSAGAGLGEVGMVFIPSLAIAALPGVVDQRSASYMLLPVVLALGVGSPLVGRLLDRWGSKVVVLAGAALLAVGMVLLSWPAVTGSLWTFIIAGAVVGLGLSALLGAPVRYIMLNEASPTERTTAQGALALFTSVGQLVSSALVGAIADSLGGGVSGYGAAYLTTGVIALVMVAMAFGLKSREQERATVAATAPAVGPR
jgi:MFS family permease